MTPDALHTISAVSTLLERIGTWPVGTILLAVMFGPWALTIVVNRMQERRFDAMKQMYEDNVKLVHSHEKIATALHETVMLNTAKWSEAIDKINTNQYCPLNRTRKQQMEDIRG